MSKYAEAYAKTRPFYVLGWNDCGTIANKFIEEAERAVRRRDEKEFPDEPLK